MKISISGPASVRSSAADREVTDPAVLARLGGRGYEEDTCARYVDPPLDRIGLVDGVVRLRHDPEAGVLLVVTEYGSPRRLKPKELDQLVEETTAQWSDGIGEGAWTDFGDELGVWVDLSPDGQKAALKVVQCDDGVKIAAPRPSPLLAAAKSGNLPRIRKLLDEGADLNPVDRDGFTPLDLALYGDHLEAARLLIKRGADLTARGPENFSPLTTATIRGHAEIARLMLERGADVNGRRFSGEVVKYAPLKMACNRRKLEVGRVLLEFGADVHEADPTGYTPLMMLGKDDVEFARLLLERGADPGAKNDFGGVDRGLLRKLGL